MLDIVIENANVSIGNDTKRNAEIVSFQEMLRKILWCLRLQEGTWDWCGSWCKKE